MADQDGIASSVFLQPGELFTTETPARVKTVVGSCLAIMIRVPRLGMAAIAHCLLPEAGVSAGGIHRNEALRYVDTTIEVMVRELTHRGATLKELEVKVFGGADGLAAAGGYRVGHRNVETASAVLAVRGLGIAAGAVGGRHGRLLEFDTASGDVLVKQLPAQSGNCVPEGR